MGNAGGPKGGKWGDAPGTESSLVPMMVLMPEQQRAAMLGASFAAPAVAREVSRLDRLYDEAMTRFDAFCFWYARPARTLKGMRDVAQRLEVYGSPEALRIAGELRTALDDTGA